MLQQGRGESSACWASRFTQQGADVNLERALPSDGQMSGYLMQGQIEATVVFLSVKEDGMARYCEVERPAHLRSSILPNRLVVLNGVTLTVIECQPDHFSFALIPPPGNIPTWERYTQKHCSTWRPLSLDAT